MRPHVPVLALAAALSACGSDTGRARVELSAAVRAREAPSELTTEQGWQVELEEAALRLDGLYFFEGAPLFAAAGRWERVERGLRSLLIGEAWAHPGHYVEGEALADVLTPATIDLLAGTTELGRGNGVTGSYRSARVVLGASESLDGQTATLRGVARREGREKRFLARLELARAVEGVAFGAEVQSTPGQVLLEVDLRQWVRRIDFDLLPDGAQPTELIPGSQAHNAFTRGVENTTAYHFTWID